MTYPLLLSNYCTVYLCPHIYILRRWISKEPHICRNITGLECGYACLPGLSPKRFHALLRWKRRISQLSGKGVYYDGNAKV